MWLWWWHLRATRFIILGKMITSFSFQKESSFVSLNSSLLCKDFFFFFLCVSHQTEYLPDKGTETQGSHVNYLLSMWSAHWSRSVVYLLLVCNNVSTEIESKHLEVFIAFWHSCIIQMCDHYFFLVIHIYMYIHIYIHIYVYAHTHIYF